MRNESCLTQHALECLCSTALNSWATTTASSLSSSGPTLPRDAGGSGGGSFPSVLMENPWNTARPQVRVNARHPRKPLAVGGMPASLPPFPQVVDSQGTEAFTSHHSLPADPTVALPPVSLRAMSAAASPAASTVSRAPGLDAPLGSSSSSTVGEAPKFELSGSSGEMGLLDVGMQ